MKKVIILILLLINLLSPAYADFQDGYEAYYRGDYKTAFSNMEPLAKQGDAIAQFIVGELYQRGLGVRQNYDQAIKWYKKSANQGDVDAQYNLGKLYQHGEGVKKDYKKRKIFR